MIEIEFDSMEDAAEAVKELSYLGKAKIDKKIHHDVLRNYFLNTNYENALDNLKNVEKIAEENENFDYGNPAEYLYTALIVLKKLFETGKFKRMLNKVPSDAEDELLELVAEMDENEKFKDLKIMKKEMDDVFQKVIKSALEVSEDEDDVENSDLSLSSEEHDESSDLLDPEDAPDSKDVCGSDFEFADDNPIINMLDLNWKRKFLISPIIQSIYFYSDSPDPYSDFMDNVYLDITELEDYFDSSDLRIKISSNIYVTYILDVGLEFALQTKDFIDSLSNLPVVNEDVSNKIQLFSVIADEILSVLEEAKKVKYRKFISDITERINDNFYHFEEIDVEFSIDSDLIELFIKDLARIGLIKTKGKKIIRYAMV